MAACIAIANMPHPQSAEGADAPKESPGRAMQQFRQSGFGTGLERHLGDPQLSGIVEDGNCEP